MTDDGHRPPRGSVDDDPPDKSSGDLLVREGVLSPDVVASAMARARRIGESLVTVLSGMGVVDEATLAAFFADQHGVTTIDLTEFALDESVMHLLDREYCERFNVIPVAKASRNLIVAFATPNVGVQDDIAMRVGDRLGTTVNIEVVVAPYQQIRDAIERFYGDVEGERLQTALQEGLEGLAETVEVQAVREETVDLTELAMSAEEAPIVRLVNLVLVDAIRKGASDIHIEPYEKMLRIRFRIDGVLRTVLQPEVKAARAIVSRIKVQSGLDIAERRMPQDGRMKVRLQQGREVDFRVSVMPVQYGEKVVLRLLDKQTLQTDMTRLGFDPEELSAFKNAIGQPVGMVLVTGPTGSGKTTTLYSALDALNRDETNISTAEDPIEFDMPGINQVQMNDAVQLNFASALRAFLRQDPDIIMVGEIRDYETAEIAVKAALTGHLVLSTLHTNDAPSTISRLIDMGVEPFLAAQTLNVVVAQRLVRRVCTNCIESATWTLQECRTLGMTDAMYGSASFQRGRGCDQCNDGYKGRIAVYELCELTPALRRAISDRSDADEIKAVAMEGGMRTLRQSALAKLAQGLTTPDEVRRVTRAD